MRGRRRVRRRSRALPAAMPSPGTARRRIRIRLVLRRAVSGMGSPPGNDLTRPLCWQVLSDSWRTCAASRGRTTPGAGIPFAARGPSVQARQISLLPAGCSLPASRDPRRARIGLDTPPRNRQSPHILSRPRQNAARKTAGGSTRRSRPLDNPYAHKLLREAVVRLLARSASSLFLKSGATYACPKQPWSIRSRRPALGPLIRAPVGGCQFICA